MDEPRELQHARERLARAEASYRSADGLALLEEGLALLDDLMAEGESRYHKTARNVGAAYATRICASIGATLAADRAIPEPALEHLFRVVLALDEGDFELPAEARGIKLAIAKRLIDRYYEGHPPEKKREALDQLMKIAKGR